MHRLKILSWALPLLVALVALPRVEAATPDAATLASDGTTTTWTGDFAVPNILGPTYCVVEGPYCDRFDLTIPVLDEARSDVVVSAAADDASEVILLSVHDESGTMLANDESASSSPSVTLHAPLPGRYIVYVESLLYIPTASDGSYSGAAAAVSSSGIDLGDGEECSTLENTFVTSPDAAAAAVSEALAGDDGRTVTLDLLVLLDGVDLDRGRQVIDQMSTAYVGLNIEVAADYEVVDPAYYGSLDGSVELIERTRERFEGGRVPASYDVVELLTSRDIQALGQYAVAGQADCLGGVAYDTRSYNVSEAAGAYPDEGFAFGPTVLGARIAAKITAHEIGHLFGGQHHYANCIEGNDPDEELSGDTSPCTLMGNVADFDSLSFGRLNGAVVRGYALLHATAND